MFLIIKTTAKCNLKCSYCSDIGDKTLPKERVLAIYRDECPDDLLLSGGECMTLGPDYFMWLLDRGVRFSIQTNLTLYNKTWNKVFNHENFRGLSISGDKMNVLEFLNKYELLRTTTEWRPPVLVLATDKEMVFDWYNLAVSCDFPIKFNYLVPSGRIAGDWTLKVTPYYKMMSALIDIWDMKHEVQPLTDLVNYFSTGRAVCPNGGCVVSAPPIYSVEPDGVKYFCGMLGSMKKHRQQLEHAKDFPVECVVCENFVVCRGCYVRNLLVRNEPDYCGVMRTFFNKLKRKADVSAVRPDCYCRTEERV